MTRTVGELFDISGSNYPLYTKNDEGLLVASEQFIQSPEYMADFVPQIDENYKFNPEDLRIIALAYISKTPAYIYGHAGVGKTTLIEQFCARTKRPYFRVQHTVGLEESNIIGQWVVRNGETQFELGPLPYAMKHGMVYCADEYDFAQPAVLSLYQAVLEGKPLIIKEADLANRVIKPHPEFRFFATGNTNGTGDNTGLYQGTSIQNMANYERFGIVHMVDYMPEVFEREILLKKTPLSRYYQKNAGATNGIIDSVMRFAQQMRMKFNEGVVDFAPSIRVLVNAVNVGWSLGDIKAGFKLAYSNRMTPESKMEVDKVAEQYIIEVGDSK